MEVQQWRWRVIMLERLPVPRGRAGLLQSLLASSSDPDFVPALSTCVGWIYCPGVVSDRSGET